MRPWKEKDKKGRSMQQIQQIQQGAKCPHGFPVGMCPICSGGGGVSKDKNKPRVPGEMSYNECMAAWIKIQAAKEARIQERIERAEMAKQRLLESRAMLGLDKIDKVLDKILEPLPQIIKTPLKFASLAVISLILKIPVIIKNIQNFAQNLFTNLSNFIFSTGEKLASIFGEIKNFANDFLKNKFKKTKEKLKTILTLFTESEEGEGENREKIKNILEIILEKIKGSEK